MAQRTDGSDDLRRWLRELRVLPTATHGSLGKHCWKRQRQEYPPRLPLQSLLPCVAGKTQKTHVREALGKCPVREKDSVQQLVLSEFLTSFLALGYRPGYSAPLISILPPYQIPPHYTSCRDSLTLSPQARGSIGPGTRGFMTWHLLLAGVVEMLLGYKGKEVLLAAPCLWLLSQSHSESSLIIAPPKTLARGS